MNDSVFDAVAEIKGYLHSRLSAYSAKLYVTSHHKVEKVGNSFGSTEYLDIKIVPHGRNGLFLYLPNRPPMINFLLRSPTADDVIAVGQVINSMLAMCFAPSESDWEQAQKNKEQDI